MNITLSLSKEVRSYSSQYLTLRLCKRVRGNNKRCLKYRMELRCRFHFRSQSLVLFIINRRRVSFHIDHRPKGELGGMAIY